MKKIKNKRMKILMCADGSRISKNAINFGGLIAKAHDAEILVLHGIEDKKRDHSKHILKESKKILEKHGLKANTKTRTGSADLKIIQESENDYDMIVLGSHGMDSLRKFLFGDVAYRVVQHAKIPVLAVRKKKTKLEKILICSGGSKYAEEAVISGIEIAKKANVEVTLLHVIPDIPQMFRGIGMDENLEGFLKTDTPEAKLLKKAAGLLDKNKIKGHIELRRGLPPEEILDQAEEGDYDMIVIGSHGMFGLRRRIMGAVAHKVVQHSDIPCLLVKPEEFKFLSSMEAYD